ncbi:hypothetical protein LZ32DRAFT_221771 [Colletotrichum eremochloae]|nr:hypothetical protein LZ32DRAFT_221771 [Colletotrichum eremochloae]
MHISRASVVISAMDRLLRCAKRHGGNHPRAHTHTHTHTQTHNKEYGVETSRPGPSHSWTQL